MNKGEGDLGVGATLGYPYLDSYSELELLSTCAEAFDRIQKMDKALFFVEMFSNEPDIKEIARQGLTWGKEDVKVST